MRSRARAVLLALLLPAVARTAGAQEAPPLPAADEVRARVEAAAESGEPARAVALFERLLEPGAPRDRERTAAAARAALELLPRELGDLWAARLFGDALAQNRTGDAVWRDAQGLRRRLISEVDLEPGEALLRRLIEIYPAEVSYREDLAILYLYAGRADRARAELEAVTTMAPSNLSALEWLARIHEEAGDTDAAAAALDAMAKRRPTALRPHYLKARYLRAARDFRGARAALDAGLATVDLAPMTEARHAEVALLEEERRFLAEDLERRERLREREGLIDRALAAALAGWGVLLAGAVLWLRRRGLV